MKDKRERHLRLYARAVSAAAITIGLIVLFGGWLFGNDVLIRLLPGFAGMVPSTALSIILLGLCVYRCATPAVFKIEPIVLVLALIVAIVSVLDLAIILTGTANGIDAFLYPQFEPFRSASMAPATALCLILASGYLLLINSRAEIGFGISLPALLPTLGLILSSTALVGYLFDAESLYSVSVFTAMALHTAVGLFAIFTALLALRPDETWVHHLLEDYGGSQNVRRILPVAIVVPVLASGIILIATQTGFFDPKFGMALLALITVILLTGTIVRGAAVQNTYDRTLVETIGKLNETVADRDLLLREVYHRVKNNLQQINALLLLQGNRFQQAECKQAFASTARRIEAMASVHTLLVSRDNPSDLSTRAFLTELSNKIAQSLAADARNIIIAVEVDDAPIHIDRAVPLGLVLNEILSNALEHGFGEAQSGHVGVRYTVEPDRTSFLSVSDNGRGMPPADASSGGGIGLTIVDGLVKQLKGHLRIDSGAAGSRVTIDLPPTALSESDHESEVRDDRRR